MAPTPEQVEDIVIILERIATALEKLTSCIYTYDYYNMYNQKAEKKIFAVGHPIKD